MRTTSTAGPSPPQRARHAIRTGFISSARVVTAAAVIMISVFAAFIPHGSSTIKPIALGLAVGVFVDAFLVRMTLVPAVLALLGAKAWWMPKRLDKALPHIDVEGSALVRHVEQVAWEETNGAVAIRAEAAAIATDDGPVPVDLSVARQTTVSYDHPDPAVRAALVWTLGGWRKPVGGHLAVLGRVLPEEAGAVRKSVRVVPLPSRDDDAVDVRRYVSTLLVAQSDKPWPSRRTTGRALDQAENWLSPLQAGTGGPRLADRRMGDLTTLERLARHPQCRRRAVAGADRGRRAGSGSRPGLAVLVRRGLCRAGARHRHDRAAGRVDGDGAGRRADVARPRLGDGRPG